MLIIGAEDCDEMIKRLNLVPANPGLLIKALDQFQAKRSKTTSVGALMTLRGPSPDLAELRAPTENETALEEFLVRQELRELVDEWIETGKNSDGTEDPNKRDLFRTAKGLQVVERCARETPLRLRILHKARELAIFFGTKPQTKSEDSLSVRLSSNLFNRAVSEASRLFVCLMLSDWKHTLCKCRYEPCIRRYYELKKPRRSPLYCCVRHQRGDAAVRGSRATRAYGEEALIDEAATLLVKWRSDPRWQGDAKLKERLAGKLCVVIAHKNLQSYRDEVGPKWVARHRAKIERRRSELIKNPVTLR